MSRKRAAIGNLVSHHMDAKHASLMQDYLLLQDEFVALKDGLQSAKSRKATLLAEVRFLRRRLNKLKETPKENDTASAIPQLTISNANAASAAVVPEFSAPCRKNNPPVSTRLPAFRKPFRTSGSDHSIHGKPYNDNVAFISASKTPVFGNKPNVFVTAMPGRRKISWQDQISLECK